MPEKSITALFDNINKLTFPTCGRCIQTVATASAYFSTRMGVWIAECAYCGSVIDVTNTTGGYDEVHSLLDACSTSPRV